MPDIFFWRLGPRPGSGGSDLGPDLEARNWARIWRLGTGPGSGGSELGPDLGARNWARIWRLGTGPGSATLLPRPYNPHNDKSFPKIWRKLKGKRRIFFLLDTTRGKLEIRNETLRFYCILLRQILSSFHHDFWQLNILLFFSFNFYFDIELSHTHFVSLTFISNYLTVYSHHFYFPRSLSPYNSISLDL